MNPRPHSRLWLAALTLAPALAVLTSLIPLVPVNALAAAEATLLSVRRIGASAPHNAFTDLARFHDRWFCVYREGRGHVSPDGAIQVLTSTNGEAWHSAARLTSANADLRDPKITLTTDGRLMLTAASALHQPAPAKHRSMAWYSTDGAHWGEPEMVGEPNLWLWRVTWHQGRAYGVAYDTSGERFVRLYASDDGRQFSPLVPKLHDQEQPNETGLIFLPDQTALCLLRRDGNPGHGLLGSARPPYTEWQWKDVGMKIGGPQLLRLPDGRILGGVRLYDGKVRTALVQLDPETGRAREILALPSGGDSSYPGLVWHEGILWMSYYSSHEGQTAVYLARVRMN